MVSFLTIAEAEGHLGCTDLASYFESSARGKEASEGTYHLPERVSRIAVARILTNLILEHGPAIVWIRVRGIFPSMEHMDLMDGYRRSLGERREIDEAPVHHFALADKDSMISILSLAILFLWDVEVLSLSRKIVCFFGHDEFFNLRVDDEATAERFKPHLRWLEQSLEQSPT